MHTATLHDINSCILKLSKVLPAVTVCRGIANGLLPKAFWTPNEQNICGGVEFGLMSTTQDHQVAKKYSKSANGVSTILEMQLGMADRGADLSWLSQYPHEREICFGPLTGIEVLSTRVERTMLVVDVRLNIN